MLQEEAVDRGYGASIPDLQRIQFAGNHLLPHCGRIAVVSRPAVDLPPLPAETVLDGPGPQSPLNALATGLAAVDAERVLVLACDLPLAAPLISRLAAVPLRDPVVAADAGGRAQPLCGRYARSDALAACADLLTRGEQRLMPGRNSRLLRLPRLRPTHCKIVVVAAIPNASVRTTVKLKPRFLRNPRSVYVTSFMPHSFPQELR